MKPCKCGCGLSVKGKRVFVDKEHQLRWMSNGGASLLNALQPLEAKERGGHVAGSQAAESGRLADASRKGGAKAREIAERFRALRASQGLA
jgi:hypothetical protein